MSDRHDDVQAELEELSPDLAAFRATTRGAGAAGPPLPHLQELASAVLTEQAQPQRQRAHTVRSVRNRRRSRAAAWIAAACVLFVAGFVLTQFYSPQPELELAALPVETTDPAYEDFDIVDLLLEASPTEPDEVFTDEEELLLAWAEASEESDAWLEDL